MNKVDLFDSTYRNFQVDAQRLVRQETYGEDIGQNGWMSADEWRTFLAQLRLAPGKRALDVACGSGGPALFMARTTGCEVTGVDVNEHAIPTAIEAARAADLVSRATFIHANASERLPLPDASFDAITCIDSILQFVGRGAVLAEWQRLLTPGGRALYTDPLIVTGRVTSDEVAIRCSIGVFELMPVGENERLIREAGLELVCREDVTDGAAVYAKRWHDARVAHGDAMIQIEGRERFEGLQRFLAMVHRVSGERRLSRHAFLLQKPA